MYPGWKSDFNDTDFQSLDTNSIIQIRATITDLPHEFLPDDAFGLMISAWSPSDGLTRPPSGEDDEQHALLIELRVDEVLEPTWWTIGPNGDEKRLGARFRRMLGSTRVSGGADRHVTWARESVLSRLTPKENGLTGLLANAFRVARASVDDCAMEGLRQASTVAYSASRQFGVATEGTFHPGVDPAALKSGGRAFGLCSKGIPVRCSGLGTKRLVALALHQAASTTDGIALVDEFEHGLEPHRIRSALLALRSPSSGAGGQLIVTTHSPTVVREFGSDNVFLVRQHNGCTTVAPVPEHLRPAVNKAPDALLSRKVVVVEGDTEEGLLRALDEAWRGERYPGFGCMGAAVVDGGGSTAPKLAGQLCELGFDVCLFVDNDVKHPRFDVAKGAKVVKWPKGYATESQLVHDLPRDGLLVLVNLSIGMSFSGIRSIRDAVASQLEIKPSILGNDTTQWLKNSGDESAFRAAFGAVLKSKSIFKSINGGRALGEFLSIQWDDLEGTTTRCTLEDVRSFVYGE
jgi:hypothetical protein